jgi:hypothetical protein
MRTLIAFTLFAAACTNVPSNSGPSYDSVRERLAATPASLFIHDETSTGMVTAQRRVQTGWTTGTTALTIDHGYVHAGLDDTGALAIDQLELALAPISLDGVFAKPTELQRVILRLAAPARSSMAWTSADDATTTIPLALDFDWWIAIDGGAPVPLATQHLPTENVSVVLGGSGDHIEASIDLDASGVLWNWADLVQITELQLSLAAETAD